MDLDPNHPLLVALDRLQAAGCAPWQRRLVDFLTPERRDLEIDPRYAVTAEKQAATLQEHAGAVGARWPSLTVRGYEVGESALPPEEFMPPTLLLLHGDGVVGIFAGGDLYIDPAHRGKHLGAELMLTRAVLHDGGVREGLLYSPTGFAAARLAHRLSITLAQKTGKAVPRVVVNDHVWPKQAEPAPSFAPAMG